MTYTHLTPDELVMIESYANIHQSVAKTALILQRSRQTINNVYSYLKNDHTAVDYYHNYKKEQIELWSTSYCFTRKTRKIYSNKSCSRMDTGCDCWSR